MGVPIILSIRQISQPGQNSPVCAKPNPQLLGVNLFVAYVTFALIVGYRRAGGLLANPHGFVVPTTVVCIRHLAILVPAARWRGRRRWIDVARTAIAVGDCTANQAADDACSDAAGDRASVAMVVVTWRRRVIIVPSPLLSGGRHGRADKRNNQHGGWDGGDKLSHFDSVEFESLTGQGNATCIPQ